MREKPHVQKRTTKTQYRLFYKQKSSAKVISMEALTASKRNQQWN